jgi:magnesium-protoporphyrin O-methyltransferase
MARDRLRLYSISLQGDDGRSRDSTEMSTCCVHNRDAGRFFGWFAQRYRKRFARKGLEPSQKHLMKGLTRAGFRDATLLEIGCGVGYLHQRLLQAGAAHAVGVDLSAGMLEEARAEAQALGLAERTEYRQGDFVALAATLAPADIVILDKVICCYPDADALVHTSALTAKRVYAFTIPRDRWTVQAALWAGRLLLSLIRCRFRAYVHDPATIDRWLKDAGFTQAFESSTFTWLTRVYARSSQR